MGDSLRRFFEKPLAIYYCLKDPATPTFPKMLAWGVLLYFLFPIDLVPDLFLPGIGSVDDLLLFFIAFSKIAGYVGPEHVARARSVLTFDRRRQQRSNDAGREASGHHTSPGREQRRTEDDYARILGLTGDRSPATVKARLAELAKQYHPDRVQHLGEEFRKMAEQKMTDINAAYQFFKTRW